MTEHPILFSTEMVRAIPDGRKTMTRRVIKTQPDFEADGCCPAGLETPPIWWDFWSMSGRTKRVKFPYRIGDRLWVRETWAETADEYGSPIIVYKADNHAQYIGSYRDDGCGEGMHLISPCTAKWSIDSYPSFGKWKPSIFMPRWASRITLEIINIGVERLQEITEEDALREGIIPSTIGITNKTCFRILWDSINGKKCPWELNPWVRVVEFKRVN